MNIKTRNYFALHFILAAYLSANNCKNIVDQSRNLENELTSIEYTSHSVNSVIMAALFIEATINEFFLDILDFPKSKTPALIYGVDEESRSKIRQWLLENKKWESFETIEKYDFALSVAGKEAIDYSRLPCQDITILISFRNYLVHYKISTQEISSEQSKNKLIRKLKKKFDLHPLFNDSIIEESFPTSHLSHDCAKWSSELATSYVEQFFNRFNISPPHKQYSDFLKIN